MRILFSLLICLSASALYSQEELDDGVFSIVEESPEFPGGIDSMYAFIQKNIHYPEVSKERGEQGTVYLNFIVEEDGSITNIHIVRGVSELIDKEAIRVVKLMPNWIPGKQAGKAVRVRFTLPIRFQLN